MSFQNVNPAAAKALSGAGDHTFIDVRTVEEFDDGHVPGSFNVPILLRSALGMTPNEEFAATIARHFAKHAKLVFV